jgi:Ca-activated chloride channel family protein
VTLQGTVNGRSKILVFENQVFVEGGSDRDDSLSSVPSLWATRKIGYLLQQIRLHGPDNEIIEEIVQLSIRYGIVTPYTSYLVTEPSLLGAEEQERIISEEVQKFNDLATMPTFGREAVEQAEGQNSLASADAAPEAPTEAIGKVRIIGAQTFILSDGIWTDTRFDPDLVESTKIEFLSEQYFSLARNHPQLAKAFALGTQVIVLLGDTAYEITTDGSPISITPAATHENNQPAPTIESQDQVDGKSKQLPSTTTSLLPCWGGLVITMLPMLVFGMGRIRKSVKR